ncbi:hypothetical protein HDE_05930 [Halotydeus destructor]|nr:hypothetical protein HDE_05930 [Halotydeus destructor]
MGVVGLQLCKLGLFLVIGLIVAGVWYTIFLVKNDGRCVNLKDGIEFAEHSVRTEDDCTELGYSWVFEPYPGDYMTDTNLGYMIRERERQRLVDVRVKDKNWSSRNAEPNPLPILT